MSGAMLVAKAGRSGWLLLLSGLRFQVWAVRPSPRRFGTSPALQPERGTVLCTQAASSRRPGQRSYPS